VRRQGSAPSFPFASTAPEFHGDGFAVLGGRSEKHESTLFAIESPFSAMICRTPADTKTDTKTDTKRVKKGYVGLSRISLNSQ